MITILSDHKWSGRKTITIKCDTPKDPDNNTHTLYHETITDEEFAGTLAVAQEMKESYRVDIITDEKNVQYEIHELYVKVG